MLSDYQWKFSYAKREYKIGRAMGKIITVVNRDIQEITKKPSIEAEKQLEHLISIEGKIWRIITVYSKVYLKETEQVIENDNNKSLPIKGYQNSRIGYAESMINYNDESEAVRHSEDKIKNKKGEDFSKLTYNIG